MELKTTKENSLTYWKEDFEDKNKKQTFQIRKCQILGLKKWSKHLGVFGFVINFRNKDNRTFFVMIDEFLDYTSTLSKKSINMDDVLKMNPIEIESTKKRTRHTYNIENLVKEIHL